MSGHSWDTYAHLQEQGLLEDVQAVPWEEEAREFSVYCVAPIEPQRLVLYTSPQPPLRLPSPTQRQG